MSIPWTQKYAPKSPDDILGQVTAIQYLKKFLEGKRKKNAAMLYGPSGSGKTAAVYALANALQLEVVEVNASETRSKDQIDLKLGSAIKQMSLFAKSKIILIDEIEGIAGNNDRGGINAMANLITETTFPVIMTVMNPFDFKLNTLRSKSECIEFSMLDTQTVHELLTRICREEHITSKEEDLKFLARNAGGDARAAINDLQMYTNAKKQLSIPEDLAHRAQVESLPRALLKILKTTDPNVANIALDNVLENYDDVFLWLDENIAKEYTNPKDIARAYEAMSKADVFRGRIRKTQHWRLLVYVHALMTVGVAVAKDQKYAHHKSYTPTTRLLAYWRANMKYLKRKSIAAKIAEITHTSSKKALQDTLPYVQVMMRKDKGIADYLDLDPEEVAWMVKE